MAKSISMPLYQPGTGNLLGMQRKGGKFKTSESDPDVASQRRRMRSQANRMAVNRASSRRTSR